MENTLILGKSGSGKTTGVMFKEVKEKITKKENLIIVDRKMEYYQTFQMELTRAGYEVLVINLNEPEQSNGFNLLSMPYKLYQEGKKDLSLRMLNSIYQEILISKEYQGDSFWINSATNYLVGLTLLLFANGKASEINLGSIYVLMMEYERKGFDKLKFYLENLSIANSLYSYLSGTVLAPIDTRGGIMATIKERLSLYIGSESLLKLLCSNNIELDSLNNPYALFIIDNEDYCGITNAIIDEISLILKKYNLIIDNADNLNKIIRLNTILENYTINQTNLYYISRNKENVIKIYGNTITDKFTNIIDASTKDYELTMIGSYNTFPNLENKENNYINPNNIQLS